MHSDEFLSPADTEAQQSAFSSLTSYLAGVQAFMHAYQPAAESPFAQGSRANGGTWWREAADFALAASFDHLAAFSTLLRGPIPRQAGYSVLRGSAEAAAIAWWVFDPDASEQERVHRGFEERLYGIHAQRGLFRKSAELLEAEHRKVVGEGAKFDLSEVPDSRAKGLTHFGRPRPVTQDLLVRVLPEKAPHSNLTNGEVLWRMLSAFSHSELWTNFLGEPEMEGDPQPRSLAVHLPTLLRVCGLTVTAHDRAFDRRMRLAGHASWETERGALPRF